MKSQKNITLAWLTILLLTFVPAITAQTGISKPPAVLVDTGQVVTFGGTGQIPFPAPGQPYYGQDAHYGGNAPSYRDNGDGTITDLQTGLMWSKAVDKNKMSLIEAKQIARTMTLGGHTDWRVPNIKELYSLIDFRGYTGFQHGGSTSSIPSNAIPFINTDYFDFRFGDIQSGERYIDAQWLTSTKYVSTTMNGAETLFGVNFADGRIKGYGYKRPGHSREKKFYARYVRGIEYGRNEFIDNSDGTVTDGQTGLMWMQNDSGRPMSWEEALQFAEDLVFAGHSDWRLPNAKELQYIVDYSRSPDTTASPAIDPIFHGPQGDAVRIHNFVRCVRGDGVEIRTSVPPATGAIYPNIIRVDQNKSAGTSQRVEEKPARPPFGGKPGRGFINRLDRDGDGKVSRSEFDGPPDRFDHHDRDNDGYISAEEAPKGPPARDRRQRIQN